MKEIDWSFLELLSKALVEAWLADEEEMGTAREDSMLPIAARDTYWLGRSPASDAQLIAAERRLGCSLPPSYRSFLQQANGWAGCSVLCIPHGICNLDPIEEIDWFRVKDARIGRIEAVRESHDEDSDIDDPWYVDIEHFEAALLIGESDGNECILLNPRKQHDGEWQVITYDKECGFEHFDSFHAFMRGLVDELP